MKRQIRCWLAAIGILLPVLAHAGQYHATELGTSLPMWMETLASINEDGDTAWTTWNGQLGSGTAQNATQAQFWYDGDTLTLDDPTRSAWAVGVTNRLDDGGTTRVGITGSTASSQRLTDRSAVLWTLAWTPGQSAVPRAIDLGAQTPKLAEDASGTVQQSAAYGILARSNQGDRYWVGGFARDKVNNTTFPQPVIWTVDNARSPTPSIDVTPLPLLSDHAPNGTGYVSSLAHNEDTGETWACGNSTDSGPLGAYNQATCWDLTAGIEHATIDQQLNIDLQSTTGGFGMQIISSMVHRVRTLPLTSKEEHQTVAVGAALVDGPNGPKWKAWVYNLDTHDLHIDLGLTSADHETFGYDVASVSYEMRSGLIVIGGTPPRARGMVLGGISSTTASSGDLGGLTGGLAPPSVAAMRGVERRMLLQGITDAGRVCAIDDDSEYPQANYEQIVAFSPYATHRLAMSNGALVRLTRFEDDLPLTVNQREYSLQTNIPGLIQNRSYYHVVSTATAYDEAILRIADSLGCNAPDFTAGTCTSSHPAAFDITDDLIDDISLTKIQGVLRSAQQSGVFPAHPTFGGNAYKFAQIALRTGNNCTMTPVKADVTRAQNPVKDHPDDPTPWAKCGSNTFTNYNTDISKDVRHCGQCDRSANDQMTCTTNTCEDGQRTAHVKTSGNECWVDGQGQWQQGSCVTDGTLNPAFGAQNRCSLCDVAQSRGDWSTTAYQSPVYQCVAHHDSTGPTKKNCPNNNASYAGAFYGDGNKCLTTDRGGNRFADFQTNDYVTNHPCARFNEETSAATTNVNNASYWQVDPNAYTKPLPTWPNDFFYMPSSEHNGNNNFTQAKNIRDWIFARRIRYLGQLTDKYHRTNAVLPDAATTFYLPVMHTTGTMLSDPVWFAVYYNDENKQRDKIIATIQYDTSQMDLDVELHFACAHDGKGGHPRLDGIRHCGPANGAQDVGLKSCTRQWYTPLNPSHANNDNGRYTSCRADKGKAGASWGEGIRLVGQLDCGKKPSSKHNKRDGWAFVRVQRRPSTTSAKNNPHVCTPLKITWQSDGTGPDGDVPVDCNWDP